LKSATYIAKWAAIVLGSWFLLHIAATTIDGLTNNAQPADCLLVLGNTVNADGSLSPRLRGRLDKALVLYRAGISPIIFVSGGLGKEGHYEGTAMRQYLVSQGVPDGAVLVDNAGNTTQGTARNFAATAQLRHFSSVVVVSQFFHISRTKLLLKQQQFPHIYGAHANYYELRDIYALIREFAAYYTYLF
jgi:vancomycin permeability regulator SanA